MRRTVEARAARKTVIDPELSNVFCPPRLSQPSDILLPKLRRDSSHSSSFSFSLSTLSSSPRHADPSLMASSRSLPDISSTSYAAHRLSAETKLYDHGSHKSKSSQPKKKKKKPSSISSSSSSSGLVADTSMNPPLDYASTDWSVPIWTQQRMPYYEECIALLDRCMSDLDYPGEERDKIAARIVSLSDHKKRYARALAELNCLLLDRRMLATLCQKLTVRKSMLELGLDPKTSLSLFELNTECRLLMEQWLVRHPYCPWFLWHGEIVQIT